jgi:hypothetical protein
MCYGFPSISQIFQRRIWYLAASSRTEICNFFVTDWSTSIALSYRTRICQAHGYGYLSPLVKWIPAVMDVF